MMGIKLRYWLIGIVIISAAVTSGAKYQLNPYNTASDTFRGRVLGFEIFRIPSGSMQPTLVPGDNIFVSTRIYNEQEPQINDVIIFLYPKNKEVNYVKRLIGLGGDTVRIENFNVYVNDKIINQTYLDNNFVQRPFSRYMQEITIPEDKLFVLGDNRDNSNDGRFFGLVDRADVIGKAKMIILGEPKRIGQKL
ncbi:signal peptidase I [Leucothrix arctica]|uniref:Signal peptidase I n=1 Tax=Leucothrix arctica TaxID=1481894 RepID=A0A317CG39_9GAMM|nr:signal peptidase I [Leucothrix arctica]PWQ96383.1 signal peptidase I [Leucothrix arctica]